MEAMRVSWTDERLDDLNAKVDRIDQRVDDLRREMHEEFRAVRGEIKTLMMVMVGGFVTLFATMLGVIATTLTQA
ncbi:MAG TPA: hypothetical protein VFU04_05765 [Solirubrobacterales bacterium]|nr:hypothetical protein [Solirubrobacterales bacterium]